MRFATAVAAACQCAVLVQAATIPVLSEDAASRKEDRPVFKEVTRGVFTDDVTSDMAARAKDIFGMDSANAKVSFSADKPVTG